ncbi:MAG: tripartite tricarboxylate transporter substrate binding protein [Ottowia sp.]|uniref:tripartite tricarboxylate transporter substrate binding protein n=1 Tax=Ottowia sp. TaxID=1898956 RepID=UPI003C7663E7
MLKPSPACSAMLQCTIFKDLQTMIFNRRFIQVAALAILAGAAVPSMAQSSTAWPNKPIHFVTPYPPGGSSDVITRFIGDGVSRVLGQPVVIENKPGAAATMGTDYAARQAPDGYTFLVAPTAAVALAPYLLKTVKYSYQSFEPVAKLASSYGLITARKDAPFSDYKGMIAYAKAHPNKLTFATNGVGSIVHMTGVQLHSEAGVQLTHIPYKGASESTIDLMGGRIDLMYDPATAPRVKAGDLKGLATTSGVRNPELPNIPTLKEQGFGDGTSFSWFAIFAPKGTPQPIVQRMADAVRQVLEAPEVKKQLQLSALYPNYEDPAMFAKSLKRDAELLQKVVKDEGLKLD